MKLRKLRIHVFRKFVEIDFLNRHASTGSRIDFKQLPICIYTTRYSITKYGDVDGSFNRTDNTAAPGELTLSTFPHMHTLNIELRVVEQVQDDIFFLQNININIHRAMAKRCFISFLHSRRIGSDKKSSIALATVGPGWAESHY
jgi:hypothetical protein